jgi:hypothetical protein
MILATASRPAICGHGAARVSAVGFIWGQRIAATHPSTSWRALTPVVAASTLLLSGCILFPMDPAEAFDPVSATVEVANKCPLTILVAIGDGYDPSLHETTLNEDSVFVAPGESIGSDSFDTRGVFYVVSRVGGADWITTAVPFGPDAPHVMLDIAGTMCEADT